MGEFWCPVGGRCADGNCQDDGHGRCETHYCPLISTLVLHGIREEVRRPLVQGTIGWKARVEGLEAHLRELVERGEGCILADDWPKPDGACGGCHWCRALVILGQIGEYVVKGPLTELEAKLRDEQRGEGES